MVRRIWKSTALQLVIVAAVLLLLCLFYVIGRNGKFTSFLMISPDLTEGEIASMQVVPGGEDVLRLDEIIPHDQYLELRMHAMKKGTVPFDIYKKDGELFFQAYYSVGPMLTVFDWMSGDFTGSDVILFAISFSFLLAAILMLRNFLAVRGSAFYSYRMVFYTGFSFFAAFFGIVMLGATIRQVTDRVYYSTYFVYEVIRRMCSRAVIITTPFILVFAVLMCISNIALLRHEKPRFRNVLGILLSFLLVFGAGLVWLADKRVFHMSGQWKQLVFDYLLQTIYATTYVYFECILIGAVLCGILAARHNPAPDKDYCVILGCGFRKDGTLTPLLRGRVDRAIQFAEEQKRLTGKELVFVPSGGQGKDEVMAEADAMKRYMLEQGIPEEQILAESLSRNTYENMANSKTLIEERTADAKVIYATTNYHVFRSGVWASLAGLRAEGIGSRTKWWFWPNAFVRECVGLFVNRWRQELLVLLILVAFFAALNRFIPL